MPWLTIGKAIAPMAINWLGNKLSGGGSSSVSPTKAIAEKFGSSAPSNTAPMPTVDPVLSYGQATRQASDVMNPIYDQNLQRTMKSMDNQNMARGFYGQMPGDALKNARAVDVERGRAGQISSLANQMVGQSQQTALQQQQMAQQHQQMSQQYDLAQQGQQMQQSGMDRNFMSNLLNTGLQGYFNYQQGQRADEALDWQKKLGYYNATWQWPNDQNPFTGQSGGLNTQQILRQIQGANFDIGQTLGALPGQGHR